VNPKVVEAWRGKFRGNPVLVWRTLPLKDMARIIVVVVDFWFVIKGPIAALVRSPNFLFLKKFL
jgi:hypothetical protein